MAGTAGHPSSTDESLAALTADGCRALFRSMASGVAIITTESPSGSVGMTASAVMSLSLSPPMIVASLTKSSGTLRALRHSGFFGLHLLRDDQLRVARAFSLPCNASDRFAGVRTQHDSGPPLLADALAWATCRVERVVDGGDHRLVIGRLLTAQVADGAPLIWHNSNYRQLAEQLRLVHSV